tara:strand:- start:10 stop:474 length:465 start_codon:yes stop_codon:yes gene_type:complete
MQHSTKRKRGKRGSRWSIAGSVTGAAKLFEKDRATIHRWIKLGLICKCDKDGVYCKKGRFIWLQDIVDFLARVAPKRGKALNPDAIKRPSWKLKLDDPERQLKRSRVEVAVRRLVEDIERAKKPISATQAGEYLARLAPALKKLQKIAGRKSSQ